MRYAKFVVAALAAATGAAVPLLADDRLSTAEWLMIGAAALGALGVWAVPNRPPVDPGQVRPLSGPPKGY